VYDADRCRCTGTGTYRVLDVYVRGKYGTVPFGIYREVYVRPFGTNRIGTGCVRTSNQTGYSYVEELSVYVTTHWYSYLNLY
jgi:hypothetical protein